MACGIYDTLIAVGYAFVVGVFGLLFTLIKISWDSGEKNEMFDLQEKRKTSNANKTTCGSNIQRRSPKRSR